MSPSSSSAAAALWVWIIVDSDPEAAAEDASSLFALTVQITFLNTVVLTRAIWLTDLRSLSSLLVSNRLAPHKSEQMVPQAAEGQLPARTVARCHGRALAVSIASDGAPRRAALCNGDEDRRQVYHRII